MVIRAFFGAALAALNDQAHFQRKTFRMQASGTSPKPLFRSAADADATEAPAVAIPEALTLPVATAVVAGARDVRRSAVIARSIIAARAGDRATDDRAADQTGRETRAAPMPMLRLSRCRRCQRRNRQRRSGGSGHHHFLH